MDLQSHPDALAALLARMVQPLQEDGGGTAQVMQGAWWAMGRVSLGVWPGTHVPVRSRSGRMHVVLDGYVRNLEEVAGQPVKAEESWSVLADLLEQHGPEIIERLRGPFALAAIDTTTRTVYLASNRFGVTPLYYAVHGARLLWGSKVRSLLRDPALSSRLDLAAVAQLLSCEYVLDDRTLITSVRVLPAASLLTFRDGSVRVRTYWRQVFAPQPMTAEKAADRFGDLLSGMVNRVFATGIPVGMPLSGGLDSRTIAASIAPSYHPVPMFSFGLPWSDDLIRSREVAAQLHAAHHAVVSSAAYLPRWAPAGVRATDGQVGCVHYQIAQLMEDIDASQVRIVFDGLGGGRYRNAINRLQNINAGAFITSEAAHQSCVAQYNTAVPLAHLAAFMAPAGDASAAEVPHTVLRASWEASRSASSEVRNRLDYMEFHHRVRRFAVYGSTHLRTRVEVAFPYMDEGLVDFLLQLPLELRVGRVLFTTLYRRRWPTLGRIIHSATGMPVVSTRLKHAVNWRVDHAKWRIKQFTRGRIRWRDRTVPTDYPSWLRGALAPWVSDLLLSPHAASRRIVDARHVQRLWEAHRRGAANHTWTLGALLTLELWLRQLVSDRS